MSLTFPLARCRRARSAAQRSPGFWSPLWLLDEPTTALDAASQAAFAAIMAKHLAGGGLLVAATHAPLGLAGARELRLGAGAGVAA
jgi:heme exporter protein A